MNILEEIQNCPVEWKELGEVCELKNGYTPSKTNKEFWENGTIPWFRLEDIRKNGRVLSNSLQHVSRNAVKGGKVFTANSIIISTTATIGEIALITVPFLCNQQITAVMKRQKYDKDIDMKFLFYYLHILSNDMKKGINEGSFPIVSLSKMRSFKIPIPPLEIQEKIVQILDKMTEYVTELTSELTSRKKQYSFYRDKLLSFEDEVYQVEWKTLGEIAENLDSKRKAVAKGGRSSGVYPYYGASGIVDYVDDFIFDGDFLLVSEDGANLVVRKTPIAFSITGKTWVNNHAHVLKFDNMINQKFVNYYLNNIDLSLYISGAAQPKLNQQNLNNIKIPYPSLEIQSRIVQVLDNFEMVCNDLNIGLPKEIELRQKQYEYFRDKLLTFVAEGEYTESRVEEWDNSAIIKLLQWVFGPIRVKLGAVAEYSQKRISVTDLTSETYVGVDNLLQDRKGKTVATFLPEQGSVTTYNQGDILIGNIRPYLKKIWFSNQVGGTSGDVLTIQNSITPCMGNKYLYYILSDDRFFYYNVQYSKGSKMPRGDKQAIMQYKFILPSFTEQERVVSILDNFNTLTNSLSEGLPKEIELRQKQYEYWREQLLNFTR